MVEEKVGEGKDGPHWEERAEKAEKTKKEGGERYCRAQGLAEG